jgi:predicted  nucleic acid-binding Zn-ribbon protein
MSQTLSLYRLQQIDSQLDRAKVRLEAIQKVLDDDQELRLAREKVTAAEAATLNVRTILKQSETDVEIQRIKIEQIEASLYASSAHSPKELQELQNDVAGLKRYILLLEDQQLDAMLALERAEAFQQTARLELAEVEKRSEEQNKDFLREQRDLQTDMERLNTERTATSGNVPDITILQYDQLRRDHRGVAVAVISEKSCSACGSTLSAAQVQSAHSSESMFQCPSCGRILYGS